MKALTITVSFKETGREMYEYVKDHSCPSAWVKDLVKKEMQGTKENNQNNDFSIFD